MEIDGGSWDSALGWLYARADSSSNWSGRWTYLILASPQVFDLNRVILYLAVQFSIMLLLHNLIWFYSVFLTVSLTMSLIPLWSSEVSASPGLSQYFTPDPSMFRCMNPLGHRMLVSVFLFVSATTSRVFLANGLCDPRITPTVPRRVGAG